MPRRKIRRKGAWRFEHTVGIAGATVAKLQTQLEDAFSVVEKAVRNLGVIVQTEILLAHKFGERPSGSDPTQPLLQALDDIDRLVKRLEKLKVRAQIEQADIDRLMKLVEELKVKAQIEQADIDRLVKLQEELKVKARIEQADIDRMNST